MATFGNPQILVALPYILACDHPCTAIAVIVASNPIVQHTCIIQYNRVVEVNNGDVCIQYVDLCTVCGKIL